jgi:hypothetical protein
MGCRILIQTWDYLLGRPLLEYLFILSHEARIFFPELNIRLYDKNSESDFFFPSPKSEYFFQQHWESEYFFTKRTYPPNMCTFHLI